MVDVDERRSPRDETLPPHVTTPLLQLITERSLDEDYAHVAARRGAGAKAPTSRSTRWTTALAVATFGALATIVAIQTSRDSDVQALSRETLGQEIEASRGDVAQLQRRIRTLTDANIAAEATNQTLERQAADQAARLRRLEIRTGYVAVRGPGVRIEVSSAPDANLRDEVRDEDLALLVNGLFVAGAEAIAVNDDRLIALGGIRNTNRAIHVNGRPLTPPYVIEVIGDRATLQARLLESTSGLEFFGLVDALGFRYVSQNVDDVRIPAARLRPLRHAEEDTDADGRTDEEGAKP
ncbi:MAG: hypothetical protein JWN68_2182 [Nocardioides sp.]|jgi:uncharacterized protein YlxW (UPF0749 family)|uniref:DUF881 domain-containing protein n=1 Tax=Nocardioides sp. TaxID=35761 RepID=UPI00262ED901|nr:DUF881 domain-containing protein [Nocardioides sp.]MCW2834229.1 hypothetical protein [Nocardioides sp.]